MVACLPISPYFSPTDDTDECSGFRVYGVLGKVREVQFEILLRVGLFGHGWTIPVQQVFDVDTNHELKDLCQKWECVLCHQSIAP
ncbi:MAG: hypothetical protein IGS48_16450 [Oscillatoriales cyanobacterium C42_A2020_001]|nr:hypothetical protein [Leptolyngbyaceae cyanobacterium C42_A2020_001]